jgi:hypothetical protein
VEAPVEVDLDIFWPTFATEAPSAASVFCPEYTLLLLLWSAGLYCFFRQ